MIRIIGFVLISAVCSYFLAELGFKGRKLFALVPTVMLLIFALQSGEKIFAEISGYVMDWELSDIGAAVVKTVGIGYVTGICADICQDIGSERLSEGVTLLGRFEILAVIAPFFAEIMKVCVDFLK